MLALKGLEISALPLGTVRRDPDALARDDEAPEIFEKVRELRIAGRGGDGAVKREILGDCGLATHQRGIDRRKGLADASPRRRRAAAGCQPGSLHLDAGAQ